jgi:hypothetical protein
LTVPLGYMSMKSCAIVSTKVIMYEANAYTLT